MRHSKSNGGIFMSFFRKLLNKDKSKNNNIYSDIDYFKFFNQCQYDGIELELLEIGELLLPTGNIVACDPLVFLGDWKPFTKTVKPGKYPVTVCIAKTGCSGDRYSVVKVKFTEQLPVKWEIALTDEQNVEQLKNKGDYFGYPVDAGLGCFCDLETQRIFKEFDGAFYKENPDGNIYDDFFAEEFKKNAVEEDNTNDIGDWLNFYVPEHKNMNVVMFHSGYGDGYYPCYWGLDSSNNICQLIVDFMVFDCGE
jgi:hypothetical protein